MAVRVPAVWTAAKSGVEGRRVDARGRAGAGAGGRGGGRERR